MSSLYACPVPQNYFCFNCKQVGNHWIMSCPDEIQTTSKENSSNDPMNNPAIKADDSTELLFYGYYRALSVKSTLPLPIYQILEAYYIGKDCWNLEESNEALTFKSLKRLNDTIMDDVHSEYIYGFGSMQIGHGRYKWSLKLTNLLRISYSYIGTVNADYAAKYEEKCLQNPFYGTEYGYGYDFHHFGFCVMGDYLDHHPYGSIKSDNWENLDVIANTNIMDSDQYTQVINEITSEVTGTEISKQTREKHSFYRKLSNLSLASQKRGSIMNHEQQKEQVIVNRSGGYEFDINMPNWDTVKVTKVLQHEWDEILKKWVSKEIYVKIAPLPFSRGSLRMSYYCLNLGDDISSHTKLKNGGDHNKDNLGIDINNDTMTNNNILFNKLIGNKNVFGGKLCVAKKNFGICDSIEAYFYDVRTQCESSKFANLYNKHNPPKKVAFLQASVIEVMDDDQKVDDIEFYCLESFLHGSYIKHIGIIIICDRVIASI